MRARLVWLASLLLFAGAAAPASVARAQDDAPVEEDEPRDDDEEPPPPDEPLTLEAMLRLVGEGREDEGLALLRAGGSDASVAAARRLLATSEDPLALIGAAEWVAEVERSRPPPPGTAPPDLARPVRERLGRPQPALEAPLLEALGAVGVGGDLTPLDGVLHTAQDELLASAAARGLCRSRDPQALGLLLRALSSLAAQLEELGPPEAEDPDVAEARAPVAARHATLLDALRWAARSARAQRLVEAASMEPHLDLLEALREVRPRPARLQARELALTLQGHHDARVRAAATNLLVGCAAVLTAEDHERVLAALEDPAPVVRVAAARSIYPLALRRAAPRVIALLDDPDADVRRAAHETLKLLAGQPLPARRALWDAWWAQQQQRPERRPPG